MSFLHRIHNTAPLVNCNKSAKPEVILEGVFPPNKLGPIHGMIGEGLSDETPQIMRTRGPMASQVPPSDPSSLPESNGANGCT
ncbi:hypothetical protein GDO81_027329 [Engystomops pustulosus]|uniref:Uncharacterized protein n=1 Tax=Engystomops pustulosus TaxID=76066 RepID=A0AAV6YLB3_ENGPU|nr:hypothetical protein GDO81_027329 [Engystomops pustulosus]